jgi:hypothetical protein
MDGEERLMGGIRKIYFNIKVGGEIIKKYIYQRMNKRIKD